MVRQLQSQTEKRARTALANVEQLEELLTKLCKEFKLPYSPKHDLAKRLKNMIAITEEYNKAMQVDLYAFKKQVDALGDKYRADHDAITVS